MSTKWWTAYSNPIRTHRKRRAVLSLFLAVSFASASGCSLLPKENQEELIPAITPPKLSQKPEYPVKLETLETKVRGNGKLMSEKEETLFVQGGDTDTSTKRVKEIYVNVGDAVTAGQPIMELDVTSLERDLRRKELEFRKQELTMIDNLRKGSELPPDQLEQLKIDFELQRTQLTELREQIANAKITAPFGGTVVGVQVKKGDSVKAYDPVATVADLSKLTVAAQLNQDDLKKVAPGMEVIVDMNSANGLKGAVKRLPTQSGKTDQNNNGGGFPGMGGGSKQQEDSINDYLLVELSQLPDKAARGTPLSIQVIIDRKEKVVTIPPSALRTYGGRSYVQIVDDKGAKREVDVEVGMQTSTQVEIVKGLTAGQKVVGR